MNNLDDMIWIAHRGASGHKPENTLLAIEKAIELGSKWIEVDIHYADQELFVIHDETLERTTNGTGLLKDKSKNYIRSLDAGKGSRIPYLREVLDKIEGRANIIIEIKDDEAVLPLVHLLHRYLNANRFLPDNFIVSSYKSDHLQIFSSLEKQVPIAVISDEQNTTLFSEAEKLKCSSIHLSDVVVTEDFIKRCHDNNVRIFVFTVNSSDRAKELKSMGVDGIFTDFPELCLDLVNRED